MDVFGVDSNASINGRGGVRMVGGEPWSSTQWCRSLPRAAACLPAPPCACMSGRGGGESLSGEAFERELVRARGARFPKIRGAVRCAWFWGGPDGHAAGSRVETCGDGEPPGPSHWTGAILGHTPPGAIHERELVVYSAKRYLPVPSDGPETPRSFALHGRGVVRCACFWGGPDGHAACRVVVLADPLCQKRETVYYTRGN